MNLQPAAALGWLDARVEALLRAGVGAIQLRAKPAGHRTLGGGLAEPAEPSARLDGAMDAIGQRCADAGVPVVVNDHLRWGLENADRPGLWGIHLGQGDFVGNEIPSSDTEDQSGVLDGDLSELRRRGLGWGLSTHGLSQVEAALGMAADLRPDYLGFGPVYPTASKADAEPCVGIEGLGTVARRSKGDPAPLPIVAIGGIDAHSARACLDAGATFVAGISAVDGADADAVFASTRRLIEGLR